MSENFMNEDFIDASSDGDLKTLKGFISDGINVNVKNHDGYTALY